MLYQEGVRGGPWQGRRSPFHRALGSEDTKTEGQMGAKDWGGGCRNGSLVEKLRSPFYRPVKLRTGPWHQDSRIVLPLRGGTVEENIRKNLYTEVQADRTLVLTRCMTLDLRRTLPGCFFM